MLQHLLREQIKRVEHGLNLMNVMRGARAKPEDPDQRVEHDPAVRRRRLTRAMPAAWHISGTLKL